MGTTRQTRHSWPWRVDWIHGARDCGSRWAWVSGNPALNILLKHKGSIVIKLQLNRKLTSNKYSGMFMHFFTPFCCIQHTKSKCFYFGFLSLSLSLSLFYYYYCNIHSSSKVWAQYVLVVFVCLKKFTLIFRKDEFNLSKVTVESFTCYKWIQKKL